ncbi:MAG: hypothetical protein M1819_007211 [Sarea resinae]|nr:MAG: hypothetical protein M1819_007211 [Sarea resinae]
MSTFGSSVINKSGKKLAPKAPAQRRRPGAAAPASSAVRASVERQTPSQTPQPPAVIAPSASPSAPETTVPSSQPAPSTISEPTAPSTTKAPEPTPVSATPSDLPSDTTPKSASQVPITHREEEEERHAPKSGEVPVLPTPPASDAVRPQSTDPEGRTPSATQPASIEPEVQSTTVSTTAAVLAENEALRRRSSVTEALPSIEPPAKRRKTKAAQQKPQPKRTKAPAFITESQEQTPAPTAQSEPGAQSATQPSPAEGTSAAPAKKQPKPRAVRKPRTKAPPAAIVEGVSADVAAQPETAAVKKRRRREPTPEDAENTEIVPHEIKMADLCKDLRTGKKSTRESQLRKMDSTAASKRQKQRKERQESGEEPSSESVDQRLERAGREQRSAAISAPQMRIVNGQIVLDDQSLQIDRHANAAAGIDEADRDEVEENELTRRVNAGSWLKREKTEPWTEELTDLFYKGLSMFGTDFMMISKMFPDRTRRQIKLKFCKEERVDLQRINAALTGPRLPVDLAAYSLLTNEEYADPQILQRELDEQAKAYEAEAAAAATKAAETLSQRGTGGFGPDGAAGGGADESSAKENNGGFGAGAASAMGNANGKRGATKSKKKKKNLHSRNGGGEEVEILGSIEDFAQ